ncbi:putative chromatin regulator PHD family [Lupinus albus]|uniref:Putative chromatin regulator PHD family n=1 Tax=Lupinus albus TaxID=3870 RepID=A0A6A4QDB6_LUPAL|nr:putative chromatin regulator PHD family [Lupinus albus]
MENDNNVNNNKSNPEGEGIKSNNHIEEDHNSNLNIPEEHMIEQDDSIAIDDEASLQGAVNESGSGSAPRRTPFTNLSQVDADLALARTLQEQERAYMMLRMNNDGSDYGSWESGSYLHDDDFDDLHDATAVDEDGDGDGDGDEDEDEDEDEDDVDDDEEFEDEDAFDVLAHAASGQHEVSRIQFDPAVFTSDEAFARALQEAEEREMAARLLALAGINDLSFSITGEADDAEEHGANSQDAWEDVDPDELSYEELLALGEVVGTESRGLSTDTIAGLPSVNYKTGGDQHGSNDSCVICRVDYEDGESLTVLSCKHLYHPECINNWLKINKVCPVCSTEVSTPGN